jgi:hypothetical protein
MLDYAHIGQANNRGSHYPELIAYLKAKIGIAKYQPEVVLSLLNIEPFVT